MRPEKVEIMRPFGPSMARSKMPQELVDAFNTSADEIIKDKEELKRREKEEDIPEDIDIVEAEKSAMTKMIGWFNDL